MQITLVTARIAKAIALLSAVLFNISGCSVIATSESSHITNPPQNTKITDNGIATLSWPDFDITLQVQNDDNNIAIPQFLLIPLPFLSSSSNPHADTLRIWLAVKPKQKGIRLDPARIFIKLDNGDVKHVARYFGPCTPYLGSRSTWYTCGKWATSKAGDSFLTRAEMPTPKRPDGSISIPYTMDSSGTGLILEFNTSSSPEHEFTLHISSIESAENQYTIPALRFSKSRNWDILPVP